MHLQNISWLLLILLLGAWGCGKEEMDATIIKGTLTDRKTGKSIEGAKITVGFGKTTTLNGSQHDTQSYGTFTTNETGGFSYTYSLDYSYIGNVSIEKDGYVTNINWKIDKGKENNLTLSLLPKDAALKVTFLNQTGEQKPLYFLMMSPKINIEGHGMKAFLRLEQHNPLSLAQGESYTQVFSLPEDEIQVYWDFFNFGANYEKLPLQDKVQLVANDTIEYHITY